MSQDSRIGPKEGKLTPKIRTYDQDRSVDDRRQSDSTIRSFRFHNLRTGCSVILWRIQSFALELISHPGEYIPIFRVDQCRDTIPARFQKDVEDLVVAELESFVCHVDLQTRDALFAKCRKFGEDVWSRIGDEEVEGVICVAVLICFDVGFLQNGEEGEVAFALRCECHLQVFGVSCSVWR